MRTLVTGGVRSGKSRHAESLLGDHALVTYVAPGPLPNPDTDPEWAERVRRHQKQRPAQWRTIESTDLVAALASADGTVLIDCLGTWVTALIDDLNGWDRPQSDWRVAFDASVDAALVALAQTEGDVVVVTNEVGWGVVPEHASGRLFRDLLGTVNQRWASTSDEVHLVVSGRVVRL
ncbi:MAG: bifunctional adenosylcobinamide kinase/adenosylcobinamide-phosphate guanylyltransferase [Aeromicrobium sp.]|nr:MAG: bifunctional adenosylcobinamide kinase/adenosylcobinamide-phosphate guanylyltransferase [Aeromicrobium sp.]